MIKTNIDYIVLAGRLIESPLYKRLVPHSFLRLMLMRRVYELWFRKK